MVGLGLDTIDLLVASVAKAIRDRMTRGHAAECEKARLGHDDAAVGHAPGTPWRAKLQARGRRRRSRRSCNACGRMAKTSPATPDFSLSSAANQRLR